MTHESNQEHSVQPHFDLNKPVSNALRGDAFLQTNKQTKEIITLNEIF